MHHAPSASFERLDLTAKQTTSTVISLQPPRRFAYEGLATLPPGVAASMPFPGRSLVYKSKGACSNRPESCRSRWAKAPKPACGTTRRHPHKISMLLQARQTLEGSERRLLRIIRCQPRSEEAQGRPMASKG